MNITICGYMTRSIALLNKQTNILMLFYTPPKKIERRNINFNLITISLQCFIIIELYL